MIKSKPIDSLLDRDSVAAGLFLAPALILLGIFLFYPIVYLLYLSFTTGSFTVSGIQWVGDRNYLRLFTDVDFWQVIGNTAYFTIATVIPTIIFPWLWLYYSIVRLYKDFYEQLTLFLRLPL